MHYITIQISSAKIWLYFIFGYLICDFQAALQENCWEFRVNFCSHPESEVIMWL